MKIKPNNTQSGHPERFDNRLLVSYGALRQAVQPRKEAQMKARRLPDGSFEFDGTPEEIAAAFGTLSPAAPASVVAAPTTPPAIRSTKPLPAPAALVLTPGPVTKRKAPPTPPAGTVPGTLPYNILAIMKTKPIGTAFTAADLVAALGDGVGMNEVSGTLSRLKIRHGLVTQVGRGQYALSETG